MHLTHMGIWIWMSDNYVFLQAAEDRRKSLEKNQLAQLAEKRRKEEELRAAKSKRGEKGVEWISRIGILLLDLCCEGWFNW